MGTGPGKDIGNLIPVAHLLVLELFDGSPGDDHAIELLGTHLLELTVEHHHVLNGCILGSMALELHKTDVELKGGVGEQTDQVCLCGNLQRHQVEDDYFQRADILRMGTGIVHHEDILMFQQVNGW